MHLNRNNLPMKKCIIALSFSLFLFSSCMNTDDEIVVKGPSSSEFHHLFNEELQNRTQSFHMNAEDGYITFTSANGVEFSIDGSCLKLNGQSVTGAIDIEFVELFDRGDMLVTNKLTMGVYNSEKYLLQSGGEFYINAKKDGQQLSLDCQMHITVPVALTGGVNNNMLPFTGILDSNGNISWEIIVGSELWTNLTLNFPAYEAVLDNFGWFNCDEFYNTIGPQTEITAFVPEGYGNENNLVLIATKDMPNSLGSIAGKYPVGLECHIIFVSELNGKFLYSIKQNETLITNHQVSFPRSEMQTATPSEMISIINALQ